MITALSSFMFAAAFTPGPNNLLCLNNGVRVGLRKSYPFNLGVFAGRFCVNLALLFFGSELFTRFPALLPAVRIFGALYLVWLAFKMIKNSGLDSENPETCTGFRTAFVLQFLNAKSLASGMAAAWGFVLPCYRGFWELVFFAAYISLFAFAGTLSWTLCGSLFQGILQKHGRPLAAVMALLLIYSAFILLKA